MSVVWLCGDIFGWELRGPWYNSGANQTLSSQKTVRGVTSYWDWSYYLLNADTILMEANIRGYFNITVVLRLLRNHKATSFKRGICLVVLYSLKTLDVGNCKGWRAVCFILQALECLVRLASVRRSLFTGEPERSKFLTHLMDGTKDILQRAQGNINFSLNIINEFLSLCLYHEILHRSPFYAVE